MFDQLRRWVERDDKKTIDQDVMLLVQRWSEKGTSSAEIAATLRRLASSLDAPSMRPGQGA